MLSHEGIWRAIDALALREDISPSTLARRAGLDSSIFNRSKRFQRDGRPRWPSTESIARILDATNLSVETFFVELLGERRCVVWPYEDLLDQRPASDIARFPQKLDQRLSLSPSPGDQRDIASGVTPAEQVFVLELDHDRFAPFYKQGAILLLGIFCAIKPGDRVLFFNRSHGRTEICLGDLAEIAERSCKILPLIAGDPALQIEAGHAAQIAKILWASQ
ncbi:helix-turn-helix transcriptional regulator [Cohaesibacter haloalkalitolerans]|uniref:helix-turn-helix transcriptional regulator n=1 Tax=Cohaesibacter haloalkalitolerans TaxID=1162980 RepID=UPI000E65A751|nr:helix-turn-helix transcriptional regulator [Cohaesibacter haloalkalitolerans]